MKQVSTAFGPSLRRLLAAALFVLAGLADAAVPSSNPTVDAAVGAGLQADGRRAVEILTPASTEGWTPRDIAFRTCVIDRFSGPFREETSRPDSLAERLLRRYRAYWRAALLSPDARDKAEQSLLDDLQQMLHVRAGWNGVETTLQTRLGNEGVHALLGRTGPLRELMLWTRQDERTETVPLPAGAFNVRVAYLDGFTSLGWSDWATCGRRGAGGWATKDALFAVVPRYERLDGEEFRVTFLAHETQHFADLARFPGLPSWRMEYRSKLVELSRVQLTRDKVLHKFIEDRNDDPAHPHSYANTRVLEDLTRELHVPDPAALFDTDAQTLNAAAARLLEADTALLTGASGS